MYNHLRPNSFVLAEIHVTVGRPSCLVLPQKFISECITIQILSESFNTRGKYSLYVYYT